jgi:hypothetical protein
VLEYRFPAVLSTMSPPMLTCGVLIAQFYRFLVIIEKIIASFTLAAIFTPLIAKYNK